MNVAVGGTNHYFPNEVDADIVFIKNIDNVVVEEYVEEIAYYKKVLAGKLLWIQKKIFTYLSVMDKESISLEMINQIKSFLWNELNIKEAPNDAESIFNILNKNISGRLESTLPDTCDIYALAILY